MASGASRGPCASLKGSGVLADAGHQPGLVLSLDTLHAPAFAEGLALVETRALRHADEGQGGGGFLGIVVHAVELDLQVVDVGRLVGITDLGALALEEFKQLRGVEFGDLIHVYSTAGT